MYTLLSQNQNYNFEKKTDNKLKFENKRFENFNNEIRKKMDLMKNFNEDNIFDTNLNSSEGKEGKRIDNNSNSQDSNNRSDELIFGNINPFSKGGVVSKKLNCYKFIIKWLDITTTILLAISTLTSQIENFYFYELNLERRKTALKIVSFILSNNFSEFNSTFIDKVFNVTNYKYTIDLYNYNSVNPHLEVDEYCLSLRYLMLILTIISVVFLVISRWIEYLREYIYRDKIDVPFFKTPIFCVMLFELALVIPIQYPKTSGYFLYKEFGNPLIIPYSSLLSSFSLFRVCFLLKLFKHFTSWTNSSSEYTCERYVCKADTAFAFKAFQKENPFIILFFIFILTCYILGMAIRTFELYYWENFENCQNWNYQWNAMWFIFVSMTTVGYGDFSPKTQFGRFITIIACLIGVYFVSTMMVFLTQKSLKNDREEKAFKLITRLNYRNSNRNLQSSLIYNFFKFVNNSKINKKVIIVDDKDNEIKKQKKYLKKCMINLIMEIKENNKYIKSYDLIHTKEQIFDISEKLDSDIRDVKNEFESLKNINDALKMFTDDQFQIVNHLKKNYYALKILLQTILDKSKKFGKFSDAKFEEINFQSTENSILNAEADSLSLSSIKKINNHYNKETTQALLISDKYEFKNEYKSHLQMNQNEYNQQILKIYFDFLYAKNNNSSSKRPTNIRKFNDRCLEKTITRKYVIQKNKSKLSILGCNKFMKNNVNEFILNEKKEN